MQKYAKLLIVLFTVMYFYNTLWHNKSNHTYNN